MKLLRFDRMEESDFPKLMEIYRESNLENISYFFPEETDTERGLRAVETRFVAYLKNDFFTVPGNRYYVLEDGGRWAAAIRLYPVPERAGSWYAEALETAPSLRRRGFARKMLELLCFSLAKDGPFALTDSVNKRNEASLAFHRSRGFEIFADPAVCALNGRVNENSYGLRLRFDGWDGPDRFDPARLSARYRVRRLTEEELPALLELCRGNPLYFTHCPPPPAEETLLCDMAALPPRKTLRDKYYLGFWDGAELAAVLDLIAGYPGPEIAFWGFFMLEASRQGQGAGTALVSELCAALAELGFRSVRLGWIESNPQAAHFWRKNGFAETGVRYDGGGYTVTVGERKLT